MSEYCPKCGETTSEDDSRLCAKCQGPSSLAAATGSATQWAARGDYVETELSGGTIYRVKVETPEACAEANRLIALGRWRVSPNSEVSQDADGKDNDAKQS